MKITLPAKYTKAFKDYGLAVAASAITMGVALSSELEPHYAVLIGSLAGPLLKWADKNSKDYGVGSKK
jgi:hypothetical protein